MLYVLGSINSLYFHIIGDGKNQPNSRGLCTHYKDSLSTFFGTCRAAGTHAAIPDDGDLPRGGFFGDFCKMESLKCYFNQCNHISIHILYIIFYYCILYYVILLYIRSYYIILYYIILYYIYWICIFDCSIVYVRSILFTKEVGWCFLVGWTRVMLLRLKLDLFFLLSPPCKWICFRVHSPECYKC